jgi:hypothetical protein
MLSNPGKRAFLDSAYDQATVDERKRVCRANSKRREEGLEALKLEVRVAAEGLD